MRRPLLSCLALLALPCLAAAEASDAPTEGSQLDCPPVPGLEKVLAGARVLLVGELHGTAESPAFAGAVACGVAELGRPVIVGIEWLEGERERVETYLDSDGGAEARSALLAGPIWTAEYQYGMASEAMLDLVENLRRLRAQGAHLEVALFNQRPGGERSRDARMAETLGKALAAAPEAFFVVLSGNIHSRVAVGTPWKPEYRPMGLVLRELIPDLAVVALDVAHAGGTAWLCISGEPCGEVRQPPRGEAAETVFTVRFDEGIGPRGHHGTYFVGPITASAPAVD